jgi:hypothetical protein
MEDYVREQVNHAASGVQDLRQEFTAQAGQVAERLSLFDDDLGRVQAQFGANFELVMQQTAALRLENETLSARLAAFEATQSSRLLPEGSALLSCAFYPSVCRPHLQRCPRRR